MLIEVYKLILRIIKLQANHDFQTGKDAGLRFGDVGGSLVGLCQLMRQCAGEGGAGRNKSGTDRMGYKRIWLCINCGWSVHLSDQAFCLITVVCPIFFLYPFLSFTSQQWKNILL